MSYFGDLLDDAEKRMGDGEYELNDDGKLFKPPNVKLLSAKIKSAPAKGLSVSQGADFVSKGDNKYEHKHKTEVKYACSADHETKLVVSNKDATLEYEYKPADYNKDGKEATLEVEYKRTPPNGEFDGKVELKCGGYELGPIKGWSEL